MNKLVTFLLLLMTLGLSAEQQAPIITDEFEGIKFEIPFKLTKRPMGEFQLFRFDLDSCEYSFFYTDNKKSFFEEKDLFQFYDNVSKSSIKNFSNAKMISQKRIKIANHYAIDNVIEYDTDSTSQTLNFVILVTKEKYYAFQITYESGNQCRTSYNMDKVIQSIKIIDHETKTQLSSKWIRYISDYNRLIVIVTSLILILVFFLVAFNNIHLISYAAIFSMILFFTETLHLFPFFDQENSGLGKFIIVFISLLILSHLRLKNLQPRKYLLRLYETFKIGSVGIFIFIIISWYYYGIYHIGTQPFLFGATDRLPSVIGIAGVKFIEVTFTSIFSFRLRKSKFEKTA